MLAFPASVKERQDAGKRVWSVDMFAPFTVDPNGREDLLDPDVLHPNDKGYELIANVWFSALKQLDCPAADSNAVREE